MKITEQQMVDAIYKELANKELEFGCKVLIENRISLIIGQNANGKYSVRYTWSGRIVSQQRELKEILNIIGHPVMIGCCLDSIRKRMEAKISDTKDNILTELKEISEIENKILELWKKKIESIESQSLECKTFVFNLIKDKVS